MERRPLTVKVALWSATHPWRSILLWIVFVASSIVFGSAVGAEQLSDDIDFGESGRATEIYEEGQFPAEQAVERVLITARSGAMDQDTATRAAQDVATSMRALPEVSTVGDPVRLADGAAVMVEVSMKGDPETATERVDALLNATETVGERYPTLRLRQAGEGSIDKDVDGIVEEDFKKAEWISVPVTLAILLVAFGALIAAGVPILLALSAVGTAIGLTALVSHLVPAQSMVSNVILLVGMAVGVDYSLFYLRREREERARGAKHLHAVEIAAATSGHAVVVSGFAVIVAMAGMFLANDGTFTSFAIGSILVVAVAVIGSLTVLPAMLAKLGRWADRPRIPLLWRLSMARTNPDGTAAAPRLWSALLRPALRHPAITLVVSVGALLAIAAGALGMRLTQPSIESRDLSVPSVDTYLEMVKLSPVTGTPHEVVVQAAPNKADQVKAALEDLLRRASSDPLYSPEQQLDLTVSRGKTVTVTSVATPYEGGTDKAKESLDRLRTVLLPQTVGRIPDVRYAVRGDIAENVDYATHVKSKLPIVIGFVLVLTFLVMIWAFRAPVIALTAIVLNLLSVGAAYGLLVLIFQHSWAEGLLDFTNNGNIITWLPLFLFVILFGLSMDYHIFVVSRIREAVERGATTREAVARGITGSAGVVTSAAIVMVSVFAIFGSLSLLEFKQLGVGLAAAVLIDATIIRAVVLPAAMNLLGRANWWTPAWLARRAPASGDPSGDLASGDPAAFDGPTATALAAAMAGGGAACAGEGSGAARAEESSGAATGHTRMPV